MNMEIGLVVRTALGKVLGGEKGVQLADEFSSTRRGEIRERKRKFRRWDHAETQTATAGLLVTR